MKSFRRSTSRPRAAFTLVEVIVAVSILLIILTATTVIWSSQQLIVQIAAAQTEVAPYGRTIESNLRRDLQGLSHDGFMVIRSTTVNDPTFGHNYSFDQLLFFANGLKSAVNTNGGQALTSRVLYGHLLTTDWGSDQATPDPTVPQWKLSLGRQDLLLDPAAPGGPTSLTDASILNGSVDYLSTDLITLKQSLFSGGAAATNMANACYRITGQRYTDASTIASSGIMNIHALLAPYCSSFRVQFAGRYVNTTPIGQVDVDGTGQIIWYGTDDTGTFQSPPAAAFVGNSQIIGNTFVFSPDQPNTWPALIQVTVDIHDGNGRFHQRFIKKPMVAGNPAIDGYQSRFIVNL